MFSGAGIFIYEQDKGDAMKKKILSGLSIRSAAVRTPNVGYIMAGNPEKDNRGILHTNLFRWESGNFEKSSSNFSAHTCCVATVPVSAFIQLAGFGEYGISTPEGIYAGNVFNKQPKYAKQGALQIVTDIAGKAYAAGLGGTVYRLDKIVKWQSIDKGLPDTFDIWGIDGFNDEDIYAVGDDEDGAIWHFDGSKWSQCDSPVGIEMNFNAVKCAGNGKVYVSGDDGYLLCGRGNSWKCVFEGETGETFWDMEWFGKELYLSTLSFVYRLKGGKLKLVDFGDDTPGTCCHLSTAKKVLWSIGAQDVMKFDEKIWTRLI